MGPRHSRFVIHSEYPSLIGMPVAWRAHIFRKSLLGEIESSQQFEPRKILVRPYRTTTLQFRRNKVTMVI